MQRRQVDENWCMLAGLISSGKSKFLNRIFPRLCLPVGSIPLTAAPTFIRYGADMLNVITDKEQTIESSLEELAVYSKRWTKRETGIHMLEVYVEEPILEKNLVFIDMPGIGGMEAESDDLFYSILPQVQVVFYFLEKAITKEDKKYLDEICRQKAKLIVIRTKIDNIYLSEEKVEDVLLEEENYICSLYPECRVCFVSLEREMKESQLDQMKAYISRSLNQEAGEVKRTRQREALEEALIGKRQKLLDQLQQSEGKAVRLRELEKGRKRHLAEAEACLKWAETDIRKAIDNAKNHCKTQGLEHLCGMFPHGGWSEEEELRIIKTELSNLNIWYREYMRDLARIGFSECRFQNCCFMLPEMISKISTKGLTEDKQRFKKLVTGCFGKVKEDFFRCFQKETGRMRQEFRDSMEEEGELMGRILDLDKQITMAKLKKQLTETEEKLEEMRNGQYGATAV